MQKLFRIISIAKILTCLILILQISNSQSYYEIPAIVNDSLNHSSCKLNDNNVVLSWRNTSSDIKLKILFMNSFTLSSEFLVSESSSSNSISLVCMLDGGFNIFWYNNGFIYYKKYDNNGTSTSSEVAVNSSSTTNMNFDAAMSSSSLVLFWIDDNRPKISTISQSSISTVNLSSTSSVNIRSLTLSDNKIVLAWVNASQLNTRVMNANQGFTGSIDDIANNLGDTFTFDLSEIPSIGYVVVWDTISGIDGKVYSLTENVLFNFTQRTFNYKNPRVVGLANGGFVLICQFTTINDFFIYDSNYQQRTSFKIDTIDIKEPKFGFLTSTAFTLLYNSSGNLKFMIFPTCKNDSLDISGKVTINLVVPNYETGGKFTILNMPSSGLLTSGSTNVSMDTYYDVIAGLVFTPDGNSTEFIYEYVNPYFSGKYQCKIKINFNCYSSCLSCSSKGDSTNHKCTQCRNNFYPLSDKSSQCYASNEFVKGYFFNLNNFSKCKTNCSKCTSSTTCILCIDPYYADNNNCNLLVQFGNFL